MPKHFVLKSTFTIFLGLLTGYFITQTSFSRSSATFSQNQKSLDSQEPMRNVAQEGFLTKSMPLTKLGRDTLSYDYFTVHIDATNIAENLDEYSDLRATIKAHKAIPQTLYFRWDFNTDLQTSEPITGQIPALEPEQEYEITLRIKNFSKVAQAHVGLKILGQLGQHQVNREALIASRPEDTFEYVVQNNNREVINQNLKTTTSKSSHMNSIKKQDSKLDRFQKANIIR